MNNSSKLATLALAASLCLQPAFAEQQVGESTNISLTIYNQNFGLVKDVRPIELKAGINDVRFEDVAAQIDPTSVSFQSLTNPNSVVVREQNYQYDLLNPTTILSKSIGKQATFRQFIGNGQVNQITGILLNSPQATVTSTDGYSSTQSQGLVIKTGDAVILNPEGQIEMTSLPTGLVSKPSLLWKIETDKPGTHNTEIAYQTQGLNWHCDYIAVASEDDSKVDLTSWVTLENKSGTSFNNASLKLVAGDVHRVTMPVYKEARAASVSAMSVNSFSSQEFAEYHLYALKGKTNVMQNEMKQLSLFNAADVQANKLFVTENTAGIWPTLDFFKKQPVHVKLEFKNSQANNLGMPLPKGKMRVYKRDNDGALQFVGEDIINHTPKDETIRLFLGDSFDVVCERKQTNLLRPSDHTQRMDWQINLRNHKSKAVAVSVVEHAYGQWKVSSPSHPFEKKDAQTFEFKVTVPANSQTTVTYHIDIET